MSLSEECLCIWQELIVDSKFDNGDSPIILCQHPDGNQYCSYLSYEIDCPLYKHPAPCYEVMPMEEDD